MNLANRRTRAFTLIELLLVMIILVILASIVIPRLAKQQDNARLTKAKADISNLETALDLFQVNCGRYPTNDEGLNALVQNPGLEGWNGPYIKLVPIDPWKNPYVYQAPGTHLTDAFDLSSPGPDKGDENDDIVNWKI